MGTEARGDSSALARAAVAVYGGESDPRELFEVFLGARVFCQRPEQPGFMAMGEPGEGVIPVFSSLAELGAFAGETDYFSTMGSDVVDLLPQGYDLVLDAAGDHPLRLDPAGWWARPVLEVAWDEREGE